MTCFHHKPTHNSPWSLIQVFTFSRWAEIWEFLAKAASCNRIISLAIVIGNFYNGKFWVSYQICFFQNLLSISCGKLQVPPWIKACFEIYMYFQIWLFHYPPTKNRQKSFLSPIHHHTIFSQPPPPPLFDFPLTISPPPLFSYLRCRGFWHSVTGRELGPAPGVQAWEEGDLGWGGGGLALLAGAGFGPARASGGWFCIRGCGLFFVLST